MSQTEKESTVTLAPEKNVLKSQIINDIMELTSDERKELRAWMKTLKGA